MEQTTITAIFRKSELFYAYERTGLATESCLSDCPVVMMPNPWLTEGIADEESGWDGVARGDSAGEIARTKATVGLMRRRYQQTGREPRPGSLGEPARSGRRNGQSDRSWHDLSQGGAACADAGATVRQVLPEA